MKLFLAEEWSREAAAAVKAADSLAAPDLLWAEVGKILWKYVRRGDLSPDNADQIAADMLQTHIELSRRRRTCLIRRSALLWRRTGRCTTACTWLWPFVGSVTS